MTFRKGIPRAEVGLKRVEIFIFSGYFIRERCEAPPFVSVGGLEAGCVCLLK